ncbi:MAG: ATP-grasp domain-containing protein [Clostridia bacterium]|nr:ATP-grasp domain-containing protein [Clostridia bacterium]
MEKKITPVLLGADLNCYSVARAFHQKYGVVSTAFGRYAIGATNHSKIIDFRIVEDIDKDDVMVKVLSDFADAHPDDMLILLGCTDDYAGLIIRNKDKLSGRYFAPYISPDMAKILADKADFYKMCDKYGILYPKTVVLDSSFTKEQLDPASLGFEYPIIVKPSDSAAYWKSPFDGMKKVYSAKDPEEAYSIISRIYGAGYRERMIIQDMIPGDDSFMNVLTCYSDRNGKVKLVCHGHVLLEEHTPKGLGNHAAILTEYHPEISEKFTAMLEDLGYVGFSNFDIKYDQRDGSYRAFEINLRQGRSNFYLTASGHNVAEYLVKDAEGEEIEYTECKNEHLWHYIPRGVIRKYVKNKELVARVNRAIKEGRATSSYWYAPDLKANPKRLAYVIAHLYNQFKKYKKYCK